jgi:hypothetical protein
MTTRGSIKRPPELLEGAALEELLVLEFPNAPKGSILSLFVRLAVERKLAIRFERNIDSFYPHTENPPHITYTTGPIPPANDYERHILNSAVAMTYGIAVPRAFSERLKEAARAVYWLRPSTYEAVQWLLLAVVVVTAIVFIGTHGVEDLRSATFTDSAATFIAGLVVIAIMSGGAGSWLRRLVLPRLRSFRGNMLYEQLHILNERVASGALPATVSEQLRLLPYMIPNIDRADPLIEKLAERRGTKQSALAELFGTETSSDFYRLIVELYRRRAR